MLLRDLYTVPDGQKMTEKAIARVLISSICSILLCMTCLVGSTWAWFNVDMENKGNVIEIATVTQDAEFIHAETGTAMAAEGNYNMPMGRYDLKLQVSSNATDLQSPVYVVITVEHGMDILYYYVTFGVHETDKSLPVTVGEGGAGFRFDVSWAEPAAASIVQVGDEGIIIGEIPEKAEEPEVSDEQGDGEEPAVEEETPPSEQGTTGDGNAGEESGEQGSAEESAGKGNAE